MRKNDTISEELISLHAFDLTAKHEVPYAVPNGYFDTLAPDIANSIRLINTAGPVLSYSKNLFYKIPESYFDQLPDTVLQSVKAADAIIVQGQLPWERNQATPYHVPQDYFDQLATGILAFVSDTGIDANTEITALSPVLSGLKDKAALSVPESYFGKEINIPETETSGKAIEHPAAATHRRKWWYPAIAAALALFAFSGWLYMHAPQNAHNAQLYSSDISSKYEKQLAQIPDANIQQYIETNLDEFDENMLSSAVATTPAASNATNDMFKDISNSDIEAYLNHM